MRTTWLLLAVACSACGNDFASADEPSTDAQLDFVIVVENTVEPPRDASRENVAVEPEPRPEAEVLDVVQKETGGLDVAEAHDSDVADVGDARKPDAGDVEAGPPPLICITNDGICGATGPWPYACCRSMPCECCNKPNCGQGDQ